MKLSACPHCGGPAVSIRNPEEGLTVDVCTICSAMVSAKDPAIAHIKWNARVEKDIDLNFQKAINLLTQSRDVLSAYVVELKKKNDLLALQLAAAKGERHE